jgi:hypothetical protein
MIVLRPCTLAQAIKFVAYHHRHSEPPVGGKFAIAALEGDTLTGVVIVGRPMARGYDDGVTAEAIRVCVLDGAQKGTPSRLLRAAWRAWAAMGGTRMITYTLASESGSSLRGAGFKLIGCVPARAWDTPTRRRSPRQIEQHDKVRWEVV